MEAPEALPPEEIAVLEANAVALGIGLDVLMEHAGRAVAEEAVRHLPKTPGPVAVLLGPGNNGGDGATAAYYLRQWGYAPSVWLVRPPETVRSVLARRALERVRSTGPLHVGVPSASELAAFPLLVDALLGVGQRAPLRPPFREACQAVRASRSPVLAVDVPTGYDDPEGLVAHWTVTFTAPKLGVPSARSGEVVLREVGIPAEARSRTGPGEFQRFFASRPGSSGRGGRVVVVGGGPYAGAPALAALAALRCGAERATAVVPARAFAAVQGFAKDLVVRSVGAEAFGPGDVEPVLRILGEGPVAALVAGPGAGHDPATLRFFGVLLPALDPTLPVVVDADALPALREGANGLPALAGHPIVATPNAGEFRRLARGPAEEEGDGAVQRLALELGVTVVRKGAVDRISDGRASVQNLHHHPAMAVAGAGDVLDGLIGALLARGMSPIGAARLGTYWAGEAGRAAGERAGEGLLASDLVDELAPALVRQPRPGTAGEGPR
jgi:ADP-dependent NAD(P)H-hydrate dehydratase / NAD(P)H-hydrate epimerase